EERQAGRDNRLGAKGCGEAGSIGSPAAVVSAVLDALAPLSVTDLDMPLTCEQLWRRIRQGQQTGKTSEWAETLSAGRALSPGRGAVLPPRSPGRGPPWHL